MDAVFLQARIDKCKEQIVLYEEAIDALMVKNYRSFSLNTGQTVETVTQKDVGSLNRQLDMLMNRCVTYEARLNGGSVIVRPGC